MAFGFVGKARAKIQFSSEKPDFFPSPSRLGSLDGYRRRHHTPQNALSELLLNRQDGNCEPTLASAKTTATSEEQLYRLFELLQGVDAQV
ncbi:MAG: hypothetical protein ACI4QC_05430 [Thermoguttaceae bacterium]